MKSRSFHAYEFIPILWCGSSPLAKEWFGGVSASATAEIFRSSGLCSHARVLTSRSIPPSQDLVTDRAGTTPPDPKRTTPPFLPSDRGGEFATGGKARRNRHERAACARPASHRPSVALPKSRNSTSPAEVCELRPSGLSNDDPLGTPPIMTPSLKDVCSATIRVEDLPVLAELRDRSEIRVSIAGDRAWIRWKPESAVMRRDLDQMDLAVAGGRAVYRA